MNDFVRNLLTEWRRLNLPFADKTFVIAISGGADSCALALALDDLRKREKLNLRFVLAHFNHKLRGAESDADENFVRDLAVKYDFELAVGHGNFHNQKGNLEQSARNARYDFLRTTAENLRAFGVLTAHTINDQAETFLLNLVRGSGIEGLSGMKPIRSFEFQVSSSKSAGNNLELGTRNTELILVRPLLSWAKRTDTENFCREKALEFRYDSMNEDLAFKRVRIRRVLLPLLQDFNPNIIETLANTANLLRDEAELLAELTRDFEKTEISVNELKNLSSPLRRRILRLWLARERGDVRRLETVHLEAIESLILSEKSGRVVELPGNETVVKKDGEIKFEKNVEKSRNGL